MPINFNFADFTALDKTHFPCFHDIFYSENFVIETNCITLTKDGFDYFNLPLLRNGEQNVLRADTEEPLREYFWDSRLGLLRRTGGGHVPQSSLRRSHSSLEVHHRHQRALPSLCLSFPPQVREVPSLLAGRKTVAVSEPKARAAIVFLRCIPFDNLSR